MKDNRYYVRVYSEDARAFEIYLSQNEIKNKHLSTDLVDGSCMYSMRLTREAASAMKLSFNLKGMMDFGKTVGKRFKFDIPY